MDASQQWHHAVSHAFPFPADGQVDRYKGLQDDLAPPFAPTPPVVVGDQVVIAYADGSVAALDRRSGAERWRSWTGGKIFETPTVVGGRVYVGSGDGSIYCLSLADGHELWRFRAATMDQRILVYGHLVSRWPVLSGVMYHDGVVYAAAGLHPHNGTRVFALDAKTGRIVWQNHSAGQRGSTWAGGSRVAGTMTIAGGRLWLAGDGPLHTAFDLKTGVLAPDEFDGKGSYGYSEKSIVRGRELGVLADGWLLHGGQMQFATYHSPMARGVFFSLIKLGADGLPDYPEIALPEYTRGGRSDGLPPAWDDQGIVLSVTGRTGIEYWPMPTLLERAGQAHAKEQTKDRRRAKVRIGFLPQRRKRGDDGPTELAAWSALAGERLHAVALASDVVLTTHGGQDGWYLTALERKDGNQRWQQPLPAEPVWEGIAISDDGSVLVSMRDGSVARFAAQ